MKASKVFWYGVLSACRYAHTRKEKGHALLLIRKRTVTFPAQSRLRIPMRDGSPAPSADNEIRKNGIIKH